jgi:hypothetical protein
MPELVLRSLDLDLVVQDAPSANDEPLGCRSDEIEGIAGYEGEHWGFCRTKDINVLRPHDACELHPIAVLAVRGQQTNLVVPPNEPKGPEERVTVPGNADVSNTAW